MTKKGRLLLIRREDPAQTGGVLPSPFKRVENGVGLGGDSPIFKIRHSVLLFAANLLLALAVLLFPFSGNGVSDAVNLIIVASCIVMCACAVWQRTARNGWRHPGRLESVPV
jgi:hypothetical protein